MFDSKTIQQQVLEEFTDAAALALTGEEVDNIAAIIALENERAKDRERKRLKRSGPKGMRCCQYCGKLLPPPVGPGRPKDFCNDACRMRNNRSRSDIRPA